MLSLEYFKQHLECCDEKKWFVVYKCAECGEKIAIQWDCHLRICEKCARKYANKVLARLMAWYNSQSGEDLMYWKHIVLTSRYFDNLGEGLKTMKGWFKRLRQRVVWKRKVKRWLGHFEVIPKWVKEREGFERQVWYIHIHILANALYIPKEELWEAWEEISGNKNVYIEAVWDFKKGVLEVVKYIMKPFRVMGIDDKYEVYCELYRQRMLFFGGDWAGLCLDNIAITDEIERGLSSIKCECGASKWRWDGILEREDIEKMIDLGMKIREVIW